MNRPITILAFAGSLRRNSYNKALLRAAVKLAPKDVRIEVFGIEEMPPFNQDLENRMPEIVKKFKAKIEAADAILIATPEYNYSIPGVLKNAIDWASRPPGRNSFKDKPVAIMSASIGMLGGARAQYHLRQTLVALNMHAINRPEVIVASVDEKINKNGELTDEITREKIVSLLKNLAEWTKTLRETRNP